jgi:hypothetical protein
LKPAPEKVAPIVMNNPPNIHTPVINPRTVCARGNVFSVRFTRKKVTNNVKGDTSVTIPTSRLLKPEARKAWSIVSGNQKLIPPSNINFKNRNHFVEDHCIGIYDISRHLAKLRNRGVGVVGSADRAAWLVGSFAILECSHYLCAKSTQNRVEAIFRS